MDSNQRPSYQNDILGVTGYPFEVGQHREPLHLLDGISSKFHIKESRGANPGEIE